MLTYLVETTEAMLMMAVMLGLLVAYMEKPVPASSDVTGRMAAWGRIGKGIFLAGIALGTVASLVMSYMKNTTSLVKTGNWNLAIFEAALVALVVFLVFSVKGIRKKTGWWGAGVLSLSMAVLAFTVILYAMPDVWAYPYTFQKEGESVFSTEYLYKLIGYLAGLILILLIGVAIYQGALRLSEGQAGAVLKAALLVNALRQVSVGLQILLAKRIIKSNHTLFTIAKFSSNYSDLFIYATLLVAAVIPVILWVQSFRAREPYRNPAEHRKLRAKWRRTRRWASAALLCMLLSVLNITVVKAIDNQEVALSPVEETRIDDEYVYVDFEQVADGHLHRFAYETADGTQLRFIVIQKPNSSSYGIGLDACDICGETGYYEKDGQVVCKLCDVVMNISTIGFKGGCNPIVIDYQIKDGQIIVPIEGLLEYEDVFKR